MLACGGAGGLFARHDNPRGIVGEGYALALNAGALLQDMEFVQFYPVGLAEPGLPRHLVLLRLVDLGRLVNDRGEDIYAKYAITERPAAERSRDRLSQALFVEARAGRAVLLSLSGVSESEWTSDPFSESVLGIIGRRCGALQRPLRVAPMAHHTMGGVAIVPAGATWSPACSRPARSPEGCTAPTAWAATRWPRRWSSAGGRASPRPHGRRGADGLPRGLKTARRRGVSRRRRPRG